MLIRKAKEAIDILMGPYVKQAGLVIDSSDKRDREEFQQVYAVIKTYVKAWRNLNGA
jgi:hypothetical protein